jgi:hypothetical protein
MVMRCHLHKNRTRTEKAEGSRHTNTPVGREAQAVDGVGMVQGVKVLPVIQVPEHGLHYEKVNN